MTLDTYPILVRAPFPERFQRSHLFLRLAIGIGIGFLGVDLGWIFCAAYLALPVIAAVAVALRGPDGFAADAAPHLAQAVKVIVRFYAYMLLLTDELPTLAGPPGPEVSIAPSGRPTVASALTRLLTSIPSTVGLAIIGLISCVACAIAALFVLITESQPRALWRLQLATIRWMARLLGYHASLVATYPPFAYDVGEGDDRTLPLAQAGSR